MDASQILKNLKSILVWHIKYFNALSLDEGKEPEPISNFLLMILPRDRDLESVSEGGKVKNLFIRMSNSSPRYLYQSTISVFYKA